MLHSTVDPLPMRPLAVFVTVVQKRSFTAAARALGISPSAVSQAVRALEATVGVPLLVRSTASVRATDAGAELARRAGGAIAELEDALRGAIDSGARVAGTLRVTTPHIAVKPVLEPTLQRLARSHPDLSLEISVDDRLVDLVSEAVDVGLRLSETVPDAYVAVRLTRSFRALVVGAPSYLDARGRPTHPRELAHHQRIGYRFQTSGVVYAWELERGDESYVVPPQGTFVTNDTALMVDAAVEGRGLAYVLAPSVTPHLASGALEVVLPSWTPDVPGFFACFPREGRRSPKVRAFLDAAKAAVSGGTARTPR